MNTINQHSKNFSKNRLSSTLDLIFQDGGEKIYTHFGFDLDAKQKQKGITFKKQKDKILFAHWSADVKGDAIQFWKYQNNVSEWKEAVHQICLFLNIDSPFEKLFGYNAIPKAVEPSIIQKKAKKAKQKSEILSAIIDFKKELSLIEIDYWAKKLGFADKTALAILLKNEGLQSVQKTEITRKFENGNIKTYTEEALNCVFAFQTLPNIEEYKILQPLGKTKGKHYFILFDEKRIAFPNFDKSKALYPAYQFALGLQHDYDISKPIYWASGESDYLALRTLGLQAVCLDGEGKSWSDMQIALMNAHGYGIENLTILFDSDQEGRKLAKKASAKYQIPYVSMPDFFTEEYKDVCDLLGKGGMGKSNREIEGFMDLISKTKRAFFCKKGVNFIDLRAKYLSADIPSADEIVSEILENDISVLDCGAGVGKNYFAINFLAKALEKMQIDRILLLEPTKTLVQQIENEYKIKALYGGISFDKDEIVPPLVVSTFDSYEKYFKIVKPQAIFIDEAHMLSAESGYRNVMNTIFDLAKMHGIKMVLMSATHSPELLEVYKEIPDKKFSQIYVNSTAQDRIKLTSLAYGKGEGRNALISEIKKFIHENRNNDKKLVVNINNKSLSEAIKRMLAKDCVKNISENQMLVENFLQEDIEFLGDQMDQFNAFKNKFEETAAMKSIRENGLIPKNIKILFATSIFCQGINIYNKNIETMIYDDRHRPTTAQIIQFVNRFRLAESLPCTLIHREKKQTDSIEKEVQKVEISAKSNEFMIDQINTLPRMEAEEYLEKKVLPLDMELIYKNNQGKYALSKVKIANQKQQVFEQSLSSTDFIAEILRKGRGISLSKSKLSKNEKEDESNGSILKKTVKIIKEEQTQLENEIIAEMFINPDLALKRVLEYTADESIKKDIQHVYGTIYQTDEISAIDMKKFNAYDTQEKYVKRFLRIFKERTNFTNTDIVKLLDANRANRAFSRLVKRLRTEEMNAKKIAIASKGSFQEGFLVFSQMEDIKSYQKVIEIMSTEICENTQAEFAQRLNKSAINPKEVKDLNKAEKRSLLWNKKAFYKELKARLRAEHWRTGILNPCKMSDSDLSDWLSILFDIEEVRIFLPKTESEGKRKSLTLFSKIKAKFVW